MTSGYREYEPPASIEGLVACLWEQEPAEDRAQRVIPDGCVDLIWLAERELVVAGPDTGPRTAQLPAARLSSGVRLRAGAAGAILGFPASEVRDRQISLALAWGEEGARLEDSLARALPAERLALLARAVARRRDEPDPLVIAAARALAAPGARVARVAGGTRDK